MEVKLTNRGLLRAVLLAFTLLVAYRFLGAVVGAVLLLATGLLLAVALSGPVEVLRRRGVPRVASVVLLVLGLSGALALAVYLLLPVLAEQATQLVSALPDAFSRLVERARGLARSLGVSLGGLGSISPQTLASIGRRLLGGALGLFSGLETFLTGLIVVLFVPLYLAAMPGSVVAWVVRLSPPEERDRTREVLARARTSLLGWLKGRLFSMAAVGVLSTLALYLIGVPGALFLGIFSGLIAFVPIIGAIAGAVPPLLISLALNPIDALWVLVAYIALQQIESNLLTPLVMQRTVSLHPAVVIAAVTVAGAAFGILGILLAVPAVVVAGVLVNELWFRRLEPERDPDDQDSGEKG